MKLRLLVALAPLALLEPRAALAFDLAPGAPKPLPEITFEDANGAERSLADFRGQVVVLNLWAAWCAPCRKEMPSLDRLQAAYGKGDDLEVVALSLDRGNIDKIKVFFEQVGVAHLEIYRDPEMRASRELRVPGVPTTLVIDRKGREIGRVLGPAAWDSDEALVVLRRAMAR
ncbi:MAG: TlpA family protein disulfide reductase [Geminicoccaceae bacterium]